MFLHMNTYLNDSLRGGKWGVVQFEAAGGLSQFLAGMKGCVFKLGEQRFLVIQT